MERWSCRKRVGIASFLVSASIIKLQAAHYQCITAITTADSVPLAGDPMLASGCHTWIFHIDESFKNWGDAMMLGVADGDTDVDFPNGGKVQQDMAPPVELGRACLCVRESYIRQMRACLTLPALLARRHGGSIS